MFLRMMYDEKLAEAAWLIGCQKTSEAIVIDPERDVDRYEKVAAANGLRRSSRWPKRTSTPTSFRAGGNWPRRVRRCTSPTRGMPIGSTSGLTRRWVAAITTTACSRMATRSWSATSSSRPSTRLGTRRAPLLHGDRPRRRRGQADGRGDGRLVFWEISVDPTCWSPQRGLRARPTHRPTGSIGGCGSSWPRPDYLQVWPAHGKESAVRRGESRGPRAPLATKCQRLGAGSQDRAGVR